MVYGANEVSRWSMSTLDLPSFPSPPTRIWAKLSLRRSPAGTPSSSRRNSKRDSSGSNSSTLSTTRPQTVTDHDGKWAQYAAFARLSGRSFEEWQPLPSTRPSSPTSDCSRSSYRSNREVSCFGIDYAAVRHASAGGPPPRPKRTADTFAIRKTSVL